MKFRIKKTSERQYRVEKSYYGLFWRDIELDFSTESEALITIRRQKNEDFLRKSKKKIEKAKSLQPKTVV